MEPYKLILSGLCLGLASADDCSGPITVEGQADVTSLAKACKTHSGRISVGQGFSGDLNLNGFEHIERLVLVDTDNLTGIDAFSLQSARDIYISHASNLSSISVPNLVVDKLSLSTLPALSDLSCATGVKPASISIHSTSVSSLDGLLGLDGDMDQLSVYYNPYLEDITLYLTRVGYISITENANQAHVSFPNLEEAGNMKIDGASTISLPNLKKAEHIWIGGTSAVSFPNLKEAEDIWIGGASTISLPSLTAITSRTLRIYSGDLKTLSLPSLLLTSSLFLDDLHNLSEVSLPKLSHIDGPVDIEDTALLHLSFDSLQIITGGVRIIGDFESVSLPKIGYFRDDYFYVRGSKKLDCHALAVQVAHAIDIRRTFQCMAGYRVYDFYGERTSRMLRITARGHQYDPYDDPKNRIKRITAAGEPVVAG